MSHSQDYVVVSQAESDETPYPYVHVNGDGTVRELHPSEREYLQTLFSPFDGGRPYVKISFDSRDGWGSVEGFCLRSCIPARLPIASAPADDPNPPMSKEEYVDWLKKKMVGFEVVESEDGTVAARRVAKRASIFQRFSAWVGLRRVD